MADIYEPFKSLGPVEWPDVQPDQVGHLIGHSLAQAGIVVDSVPTPPVSRPALGPEVAGRARAKTDSAVAYAGPDASSAGPGPETARSLRSEWKEVKISPKDNPHAITVYKMPGKDGKGAWFARRSLHHELAFGDWRRALEREFFESLKVQGSPGSGSIRGIGADAVLEQQSVAGCGQLRVFQLSAQFSGPTTPREFISLLLSSEVDDDDDDEAASPNRLRQYMVVSRPCANHPKCSPRPGIIRGQYESVELIREVVDEELSKKASFSSLNLPPREHHPTASRQVDSEFPPAAAASERRLPRAVEWLMVTRSDPGGSVPRFMVEKGTPPGIVGDAGKFLDWALSTSSDSSSGSASDDAPTATESQALPAHGQDADPEQEVHPPRRQSSHHRPQAPFDDEGTQARPTNDGLYAAVNSALGAAASMAINLRQQFSSSLGSRGGGESTHDSFPALPHEEGESEAEDDSEAPSESDASSLRSFISAPDPAIAKGQSDDEASGGDSKPPSRSQTPLSMELRKMVDRRQKLDKSYNKYQERLVAKRQGVEDKDAAALAKVREKHGKELARKQAKYEREMAKLEEKRRQEERKAEARMKQTREREEKAMLTLELDKVKAERGIALEQIKLLKGQVGELQAQNTMLVAKMGRLQAGGARADSPSSVESFAKAGSAKGLHAASERPGGS